MLTANVPVPTVIVPLLVRETDDPQHVDPDIVIADGVSPKGITVPEEIVKFIEPEVPLFIVTLLKVTPEASTVGLPVLSKVTVPPLALHVGEPDLVKLPETVIVPDGAVNVPPDNVKSPLMSSVPAPPVNVPWLKV